MAYYRMVISLPKIDLVSDMNFYLDLLVRTTKSEEKCLIQRLNELAQHLGAGFPRIDSHQGPNSILAILDFPFFESRHFLR
jgi:hypothetical protein